MIIVENLTTVQDDIYNKIYDLISSEDSGMITNVHSVDPEKTHDKLPNIVYDYDYDIRVMICVDNDGMIKIIAPPDLVYGTQSLIVSEYPELIDSFK